MTLGSVGVVVAARMSSSRLPGKALKSLYGLPMIVFLLRRLNGIKLGRVVLATTDQPADDELANAALSEGFQVFRGPQEDVVARFVGAASEYGFDTVVRVTGDCPFVDAQLVDWCIAQASEFSHFDLATTKGQFPVGLDVEIYHAERMASLHADGNLNAADREHLTLHFYDDANGFSVRMIDPPTEWWSSEKSFTIDTEADYQRATDIVEKIGRSDFSIATLLKGAR